MAENKCVICNELIPEGRQICLACEEEYRGKRVCRFPGGLVIKPDGENPLDPCRYEEVERHEGVTVHILRCKNCGRIELTWSREGYGEED